jgi:hypothetical protein
MLAQAQRDLVQHGVVRPRLVVAHEPGDLAVEVADQVRGPVLARAEAPAPEIHEQGIGLVGPALLDPVGFRLEGLLLGLLGHAGDLVDPGALRRPGGIDPGLGLDLGPAVLERVERLLERRGAPVAQGFRLLHGGFRGLAALGELFEGLAPVGQQRERRRSTPSSSSARWAGSASSLRRASSRNASMRSARRRTACSEAWRRAASRTFSSRRAWATACSIWARASRPEIMPSLRSGRP